MKIYFKNRGQAFCRSRFYSAYDNFPHKAVVGKEYPYEFNAGIYTLFGEIDSGNFAISYLLSMYPYARKDFVLWDPAVAEIDGKEIPLDELGKFSCYLDEVYPLFSTSDSIRASIEKGLEQSGSEYSCEEIRDLFCLDKERFERPLSGVGNERFRCMAAIGFSYGKDIYCFPWLSHERFVSYHKNITWLLDLLAYLNKTVIVPVGYPDKPKREHRG
ncbi:MAG: hypothetical protein IKC87_04300 [Clostridia bacterium]|nr:hypothetical protein [Clostridia bacterium]